MLYSHNLIFKERDFTRKILMGKGEKKWKKYTPFRFLSGAATLKKYVKMLAFNLEYAFYFQEEFGYTEL